MISGCQSLSKKIPRNIGTVTPTILLSSGDHKYVAWHATAKNLHLSECRQSLTSTRLCIRPPFPTPSSLDYQFLSFPFLPFLARYKTVRTDKFVGLFVEINRISNITTSNTRDKYKYKSWYRTTINLSIDVFSNYGVKREGRKEIDQRSGRDFSASGLIRKLIDER